MIALASASGFAVSTSLQHHAASRVDRSAGAVRLLTRLARTPLWLLASALGLVWIARLGPDVGPAPPAPPVHAAGPVPLRRQP